MAISAVLAVGVAVETYSAYDEHQSAKHVQNQGNIVFGEQQDYEHQLNDLMKNPSSVTSLPGYQFNFDQGATAVSRQMAAGGFLNSGNQMAALTKYGQGVASSAYQQQVDILARLSGIEKASSPTDYSNSAQGYQRMSDQESENALSTASFGAGNWGGSAGKSVGSSNPSALSNNDMSTVMATLGTGTGGYKNTWNGGIY